MTALTLRDEPVTLRADGALYWPRAATLVIADPHFGKDDIFRRAGIAIPRGPTIRDLERLTTALAETGARRILIVGDFVHGRSERGDDLLRQFALWRHRHATVDVTLVTGNHDRHEDWSGWRTQLEVQEGCRVEAPFVFAHDPVDDARGYVIAGHIHPVYKDRERLGARAVRVFWRREGHLVLPAWGEFTGGWRVQPERHEGVFACTPDGVWPLQTGRPT